MCVCVCACFVCGVAYLETFLQCMSPPRITQIVHEIGLYSILYFEKMNCFVYRAFMGKPEVKRPLERSRRRLEDNIKNICKM